MKVIEVLGSIAIILGLIVKILSLRRELYQPRLSKKTIKITALRKIRMLINRMEEDKKKQPPDSPQRLTMHHTQQDLEILFKDLQKTFNISDKDALRT